MTKKHFIEFAKQIRAMRQDAAAALADGSPTTSEKYADAASASEALVILVASQFNPRFDTNRFREACKP